MIDNVVTGPVTLKPGDTPKIDARAWEALEQLCADPGSFMLMHYEPNGTRGGRLIAAFKHRETRLYHRVNFYYAQMDPNTRTPEWEPIRDWYAQRELLIECERHGVRSEGMRQGLERIRERAEHLTGKILPQVPA